MRKTDYNAARDDEEIAALFREGDERAGKRKADEHAQSLDELAEIIGTPKTPGSFGSSELSEDKSQTAPGPSESVVTAESPEPETGAEVEAERPVKSRCYLPLLQWNHPEVSLDAKFPPAPGDSETDKLRIYYKVFYTKNKRNVGMDITDGPGVEDKAI